MGDFCSQSSGFVPLRNKFLATPLVTPINQIHNLQFTNTFSKQYNTSLTPPSFSPPKLNVIRPPGTMSSGWASVLPQMFFFVSPVVLRAPSTDRPETLPRNQNLAEFYNITPSIRGCSPQKIWGHKHAEFRSILDHFRI